MRQSIGNYYTRAWVCMCRPHVCPCDAYPWLHRKGVGRCKWVRS